MKIPIIEYFYHINTGDTKLKVAVYSNGIHCRIDGKIKKELKNRKCEWVIGSLNSKGYCRAIHKRVNHFYIHRLIANAFIKELFITDVVDHIDGNTSDNSKNNLRIVSVRENMSNQYKHREGKLIGASFEKKRNTWKSSIKINGKSYHLGRFNTEQEAHLKYIEKLKEIENLIT